MSKEFNWFTELDKAIKKEPSREKYVDLKIRAESWVTCACGELCKALPRDSDGIPEDRQLNSLGLEFSAYITSRSWLDALDTLYQIEARTEQLLREL